MNAHETIMDFSKYRQLVCMVMSPGWKVQTTMNWSPHEKQERHGGREYGRMEISDGQEASADVWNRLTWMGIWGNIHFITCEYRNSEDVKTSIYLQNILIFVTT